MAKSDDLLGGALTDNHGSQSSNNRGNRSDVVLTLNPLSFGPLPLRKSSLLNVLHSALKLEELEKPDKAEGNNSEVDQLKLKLFEAYAELNQEDKLKVLRQASSISRNAEDEKLSGFLSINEKLEELEKRDKAEGDHSELEQLTRDLSKAQADGSEWERMSREQQGKLKEEKKFRVLREVLSNFVRMPEGKLVDKLLMEKACDMFFDAFPQKYCKSFKWEVNMWMIILSYYRGKFPTDSEAVKKRLSSLCSKGGKVNEEEVIWRLRSVANSDVALSNLKSAASELVLQEEQKRELKLHWDKPKLEGYYYLCKAAAIGNENAHCDVNSPELNIDGLADSGELVFEDQNLGDIVKDITNLGHSDDHHKHPSPPHPPARLRWRERGPWVGMSGAMPSTSRGQLHFTADPAAEWPPLNDNASLQGPALPLQRSGGWKAAVLAPPPRSDGPTGLGWGRPLHLPVRRSAR